MIVKAISSEYDPILERSVNCQHVTVLGYCQGFDEITGKKCIKAITLNENGYFDECSLENLEEGEILTEDNI